MLLLFVCGWYWWWLLVFKNSLFESQVNANICVSFLLPYLFQTLTSALSYLPSFHSETNTTFATTKQDLWHLCPPVTIMATAIATKFCSAWSCLVCIYFMKSFYFFIPEEEVVFASKAWDNFFKFFIFLLFHYLYK